MYLSFDHDPKTLLLTIQSKCLHLYLTGLSLWGDGKDLEHLETNLSVIADWPAAFMLTLQTSIQDPFQNKQENGHFRQNEMNL